jgi:hypothetical protein
VHCPGKCEFVTCPGRCELQFVRSAVDTLCLLVCLEWRMHHHAGNRQQLQTVVFIPQ